MGSIRWSSVGMALAMTLAAGGCTPTGSGDGASEDTGPVADASATDGATPDPDGATPDPDDGVPDPDGSTPDPDGSTLDPDDGVLDPDDGVPDPDGAVPDPDGATPDPDAGGCQGEDCGGAPRVLTFAANVTDITAGGSVIISAVVTDPDGGADLLGGVLETPDGAPYGPFQAAGDVGTYGFTITWDALHAVEPITFDGEASRTVVGVFFDQAGNRTSADLELTLHCREGGGAACDGACVSLNSLDHCGACGAACDTECVDGACACPDDGTRCGGACVDTENDPNNCGACGIECRDVEDGEAACVDGRCRIECAPDHQLCDPGDPVCAPCPTEGVARTACDGRRCVPFDCEEGFRQCGEACTRCPVDNAISTACFGDRCVATECEPNTHPCAEGCCPWRGEPVDAVTTDFALAVDAQGAHIVFDDDEQVVHRRWIDGAWVDTTPVQYDARPPGGTGLAVAVFDGALHLVSTRRLPGDELTGQLVHQRWDGDDWVRLGGIDEIDGLPSEPALAVGPDTLWLAWRSGQRVHVTDTLADPWRPAEVPVNLRTDPQIAVDGDGTLHMVVYGGRFDYLRRPAGGAFEEVDTEAGQVGGQDARIAIDVDGHPVILHRAEFDGAIRTNRFVGREGRWRNASIARGFQAEEGLGLTRGGIDDRLIACAGTQLGLYVFYETDRDWREEQVANGDHVFCQVAVGPDGSQHVVAFGPGGLIWYR